MQTNHLLGFTIGAFIASSSISARALDNGTRAAARTLVNEGVTEFEARNYPEARQKFLEAYAVAKVPTVAVWAGQANEKLGKWVAAAEFYENALLMQPNELWIGNAQQQAQKQAEELLKQLKPRLAGVKILLVGTNTDDVEVSIDGTPVANAILAVERPLDPGLHEIRATRGGTTNRMNVAFVEAEKKSITLQAPPGALPQKPASATVDGGQRTSDPASNHAKSTDSGQFQRSLGWTGVGVGAAGLVVGIAAGIVVGVKRSSLHDEGCNGNVCGGYSYADRVDSYNAWRTISTVGFVAGGITMGLGVTLLATSPRRESVPQVGLVLGPSAVGLKGNF